MHDLRLHPTPISLWQRIFRWTWFVIAFTLVLSCGPQERTCQNAGDCLATEGCDWRKGSCVPQCQDNGNCLHAQRCHVDLRVCLTVCNDDSGCPPEERCEPNDRVCVKTPCPTGVLPKNEKCPCQQQKDCPQDTYCDNFGNKPGMCHAVCPVSGDKPKNGVCPCPEGMLWINGLCVPPCPVTMIRRHDGICVPDLPTLMPTAWERTENGSFRMKCPNSLHWKRDEKGQCQLKLPDLPSILKVPDLKKGPPTAEELSKMVGPQKPCPADPNNKWDEDYMARWKLPAIVPVVYVEAAASVGGDGTKAKPFRTLQEGADQISTGGVVLVAPGTYAWGLKINKHLHLVGRCTDGVKIVPGLGSSGMGVLVRGISATLEGFSIMGGQIFNIGIGIKQTGTVTLRHIHVHQAHEIGIIVENGGVVIEHVKVSFTSRSRDGYGVVLQTLSKKAIIRYNYILENASSGLLILRSQEVEIEDNLIEKNGIQHREARGIEIQELEGKALIRHNHILRNTQVGLLGSQFQHMEVENNLIQENGTPNQQGRGIAIQEFKGTLVIRHNHILQNADIGLAVLGSDTALRSQELEVEDNWIRENGIQSKDTKDTKGILLLGLQGKAVVRRNHIEKNAQGLIVSLCQEVEIQSNLIQENGQNREGLGIGLLDMKGKAMIRYNHVLKNGSVGCFALFSEDVEVEGNRIEGNNTYNKEEGSAGIYLEQLQGKATIFYNHILNNNGHGLFIVSSQDVEVESNFIQKNGISNQGGAGIILQELKGKVVIHYNHIEKNTDCGLTAFKIQDVEVKGNLIEGNGIQKKKGGIRFHKIQGNVIIRYNGIYKNAIYGLMVADSEGLAIEDNLIEKNGITSNGRGIFLLSLGKKVAIYRNTFALQSGGGEIYFLSQGGGAEFQNNVWANLYDYGLNIWGNQGNIILESEQFVFNGNVHLRILNNSGLLMVKQSSFVYALFSAGLLQYGQSWSAGMGVEVGAQGLVRWVFAKDSDYPCSPTKKKQVPALSGGWTMRPIRIPHKFDPCMVWEYGSIYRTEESRKNASICQKKCGETKRCRWIWKSSRTTDQNQGLWEPFSLECVSVNELSTCETPISPRQSLQSVYWENVVSGQCVELSPQEDPCHTSEMKECDQRTDSLGKKIAYCYRSKTELGKPVEANCAKRANLDPCQPELLKEAGDCDNGKVCISDMKVYKPMDVFPSQLTLQDSVFWNNPGPDVLMDMAGQVKLDNNSYHFCNPSPDNPSCRPKQAFRFCNPSPDDPSCQASEAPQRGYQQVFLPAGATLVWQNPSPYPDKAYESRISGNDKTRQSTGGFPLFYEPNSCDVLANQ